MATKVYIYPEYIYPEYIIQDDEIAVVKRSKVVKLKKKIKKEQVDHYPAIS